MRWFIAPLFGWTTYGCTTEETSVDVRCEIQVAPITETATLGEYITISAFPMTEVFDSHVQINQSVVEVSAIDKKNCAECETCRDNAGCTDCAYCADCDTTCQTCEHSMTLAIPSDLPQSNEYWMTIYNSLGSSEPIQITLEEN